MASLPVDLDLINTKVLGESNKGLCGNTLICMVANRMTREIVAIDTK